MKKDTFTYVAFMIAVVAAVIIGALLLVIGDLKQQLRWKDDSLERAEEMRDATVNAFNDEHQNYKLCLDHLSDRTRQLDSCRENQESYTELREVCYSSETITDVLFQREMCLNALSYYVPVERSEGSLSYLNFVCMTDLNCAACLDQTGGNFEHCIKYALYP